MAEYHALASPSSAHRWLNCANALAMEIGQPNGSSKSADLGTDKHDLLALCLVHGKQAMDYEGHVLVRGHTVEKSLAADVQTVLDNVRERIHSYELRGATVTVEIEQDVPISQITSEVGATGRVDVVLIVAWPDRHSTLDVIDAKFGYQEVDAEENPQLMMYAAGALEKFGLVEDFSEINLVIEQPLRTGNEWSIEVWDLENRAVAMTPFAKNALYLHAHPDEIKPEGFNPSEKTCMWCKAKAVCPALQSRVEETLGADFHAVEAAPKVEALPIERLGEIFPNLELVEDWIKAVRARIESEMFAGRNVPGIKVVAGRRGARTWADEAEAEALMKKFKLKQEQMYSFKLLGPKPILDMLKTAPRRLKQIESLVVQPEGKHHVVADTDKRPAIEIKPIEDGFEAADDLC